MSFIDWIVFIVYFLITLGIGLWAGKKVNHFHAFAVGKSGFGKFYIFATLSASFIGGGYTIGNAAKAFELGLIYSFALLGFSLKEILVGFFIAPRMSAFKGAISVGDIIKKKYGTGPQIVSGIFSVLLCAGILGAQIGGMATIFQSFFHVNPILGTFIAFAIIVIYTSFGGMMSVVFTDIFQFIILTITILIVFFIGFAYVDGWDHLMTQVPLHHILFIHNEKTFYTFIVLFLTFVFGETLVPPYIQRLLIGKNAKDIQQATIWSGLYSIPFFIIVGFIGLFALVLLPNLESSNMAFPSLVQLILPIGLRGLALAGFMAIIMSSASSFLNAASVAFVNDILRPIKSTLSDKILLLWARLITLFIGIIAIVVAFSIQNVLDILLYAYNFWAPVILFPLIMAIFNVKSDQRHFFISAIVGAIFMIIWSMILNDPYTLNGILIGFLGSIIAFIVGIKLFPPKQRVSY